MGAGASTEHAEEHEDVLPSYDSVDTSNQAPRHRGRARESVMFQQGTAQKFMKSKGREIEPNIYQVKVPFGTIPGSTFSAMFGSRYVKVEVPLDCKPGDVIEVDLSNTEDDTEGPPHGEAILEEGDERDSDNESILSVPAPITTNESRLKECAAFFLKYGDKDSYYLTLSQLEEMLEKEFHFPPHSEKIKQEMMLADWDRSAHVSFQEFVVWYDHLKLRMEVERLHHEQEALAKKSAATDLARRSLVVQKSDTWASLTPRGRAEREQEQKEQEQREQQEVLQQQPESKGEQSDNLQASSSSTSFEAKDSGPSGQNSGVKKTSNEATSSDDKQTSNEIEGKHNAPKGAANEAQAQDDTSESKSVSPGEGTLESSTVQRDETFKPSPSQNGDSGVPMEPNPGANETHGTSTTTESKSNVETDRDASSAHIAETRTSETERNSGDEKAGESVAQEQHSSSKTVTSTVVLVTEHATTDQHQDLSEEEIAELKLAQERLDEENQEQERAVLLLKAQQEELRAQVEKQKEDFAREIEALKKEKERLEQARQLAENAEEEEETLEATRTNQRLKLLENHHKANEEMIEKMKKDYMYLHNRRISEAGHRREAARQKLAAKRAARKKHASCDGCGGARRACGCPR